MGSDCSISVQLPINQSEAKHLWREACACSWNKLTSYRAGVEGRKDLQGRGPKWIECPLHIELPACRNRFFIFYPCPKSLGLRYKQIIRCVCASACVRACVRTCICLCFKCVRLFVSDWLCVKESPGQHTSKGFYVLIGPTKIQRSGVSESKSSSTLCSIKMSHPGQSSQSSWEVPSNKHKTNVPSERSG